MVLTSQASNTSAMQRRQITYTGRVQGVGFRATARTIARDHPITGWVKNEDNGSVLLEVQGEPAAIEAFLSHIRQSLERFIKTENQVDLTPDSNEVEFSIRR